MSKPNQKTRPDTTAAAEATQAAATVAAPAADAPESAAAPTPEAMPTNAAPPPAAEAAAADPAIRPASLAERLSRTFKQRLSGTSADRLAARVREAATKLPRRIEAEGDVWLDRVGLVRKSRAAQAVAPSEPGEPSGPAATKAA